MLFFKKNLKKSSETNATPAFHHSEGYLQDQLLVSTPLINSSCFYQSVIYLFAHNEEGAMGVIVNSPMEQVDYHSLLAEDETKGMQGMLDQEIAVHFGGPVDRNRGFVVHSNDYHTPNVLYRGEHISVSANTEIIMDMAKGRGPKDHVLAVGYAGWTAGQLEKEIEDNGWISVPARADLVFSEDDGMKWPMASQSLGFDMNFFSHTVGHA